MKKIHWKRIMASLLVVSCLSATTVYATVTKEDIQDAKDQVNNIQQKVDEAEKELDKHNDKKNELEGDLKNLNKNLNTLANEIGELEADITNKQEEIAVTTMELEEAEERSEKQYEDMKQRIQFMYENGNVSLFTMFLEADSMSAFLNQTEYVASINTYDREKLEEFQQLQAEIAEKKSVLEAEEQELLALREEMETKRTQVNSLIAATEKNISDTKKVIASAEEEKKELEEELKRWEEIERKLEAEKLEQDLKLWEEIQGMGGSWVAGSYTPAEGEAYLLAAIIQCEAWGEPYEGKLAVGSVVMNRVAHPKFPNTITEVIYSPKQFAPVASGRLEYRLQAGVVDDCKRAALEVLNGNITNNCLFFRTVIPGINGTVIGNHIFY